MKLFSGYSHIIVNITAYCVIARFFSFNRPNVLILLFWLILGAIFADIDINGSLMHKILIFPFWVAFDHHRGITHTIVFALGLAFPVYLYDPAIGYIFFFSYLGHLMIDSLTPMGIKWAYPINNDMYSLGVCTKKNGGELVVVGLSLFLLLGRGMIRYLVI